MGDDFDATEASIESAVRHFRELRIRVRHSAEARAIVDRCLEILSRAAGADRDAVVGLELEIAALREELVLRFGAPPTGTPQ